jgi:hypothetical protein
MAAKPNADKFVKRLAALEKRIITKTIRQAQRAGAKILATEIKDRAPVETGETKKLVKVRSGRRRKNNVSTPGQTTALEFTPFLWWLSR